MKLTVNQIILLLEIYRGAVTSGIYIGTYKEDIELLRKQGLVKVKNVSEDEVTAKGDAIVLAIKQSAAGAMLIPLN